MTSKFLKQLAKNNIIISENLSSFDDDMYSFLKDNILTCQTILNILGNKYALLKEENDNDSREFIVLKDLFNYLKLEPEFGEDKGELIFYSK